MRWYPRLLGLAMLIGLLGWSLSDSLDQLDQTRNSEEARRHEPGEPAADFQPDVDNDAPEYLLFSGGIPSGVYRVADLPSVDDWDYGERKRTPAPPSISEDNPVNYNVTVEDGPFVTSPDDGDSDDGDSDNSESDGEETDGEESDNDSLPAIRPGMYATEFGVEQCEYELRRIMDDNRDNVIGHDVVNRGRMLVYINEYEPDTFVATESCGEWSAWSALVEPLTVAGDGDYWIGDLHEGIWNVPVRCLWEKVISYRGARLEDVESSGVGPRELTVDRFTLGVRIRHCRDSALTLSDKPLPPNIQIADLASAQEAAHRRPAQVDRELTKREARRIERRSR